MGIIITPELASSRPKCVTGSSSACRIINSSSVIPFPKLRLRAQSPPIGRAAISRFQSRRSDVDCLFEKWPDQRVRLIENRQHFQLASVGQAFDRDLQPVDVVLHLDELARLLTQNTDLRAAQKLPNTFERLHKFLGGIGANHTTAAGERQWFEHAGKGDFPRGNELERVRVQGRSLEGRNIQPGIPQPLARAVFIAADVGGFWRMSPQAESMAGASAG